VNTSDTGVYPEQFPKVYPVIGGFGVIAIFLNV
jgi:hypothetical protein